MLVEIARRAFADRLRSTLAWTIGLAAMVALQLSVYPSVQKEADQFRDLVEAYPPALKALFDVQGDFTSGPGFLAAEVFGFVAPLCLFAVAIGHLAGATAAEEERGTLDLLLANPVPRWQVVAGKALAAAASLTVVSGALAATLVAGDLVFDLGVGVAGSSRRSGSPPCSRGPSAPSRCWSAAVPVAGARASGPVSGWRSGRTCWSRSVR